MAARAHAAIDRRAPGDPLERLVEEVAVPDPADRRLAAAWARAQELAVALREAHEELAIERLRRIELEALLEERSPARPEQ